MTKFKVGDKVRIIQIVNHGDFPVGYVGVITSVDEKPYLYCIDDLWYYDDEELELCEPVCKETIETTFAALNPQTGDFVLQPATLEKKFSTENFKKIIDETVHQINELSEKKGGEYAGDDDRLANFRRNANALNLNKEDIWAVYAAKHWDAVMQYIKDGRTGKKRERLESISGRCDDLIVYLLLMKAMIQENGD